MKKTALYKSIILLITGGIIMLAITGCGHNKYRVDYGGDKDSFKGAKDSYSAGSKVTLYYDMIATDTDYSFYIDGERINPDYSESKGYIIRFTMPAHDIKVEVKSVNSMIYIPDGNEGRDYTLTYDSFEGGGPEFSVKIDDESVITYDESIVYDRESGEDEDGRSFKVNFMFTGLKPGSAEVTVSVRSPIGDNYDEIYDAEVDEELNVTMTLIETALFD